MPVKGVLEAVVAPFDEGIVGDVEIGASDGARNGFRDTGRGGAVPGERVGEAVRLRKGLLDDKLSVRPGDLEPVETSGHVSTGDHVDEAISWTARRKA